jgi:hypothetical protein
MKVIDGEGEFILWIANPLAGRGIIIIAEDAATNLPAL